MFILKDSEFYRLVIVHYSRLRGHFAFANIVINMCFLVYQQHNGRHRFSGLSFWGWLLSAISQIHSTEDRVKLQSDIDSLGKWAGKLGMRFRPIKCNMMQLTRKWVKRVVATYTMVRTVLENVDRSKYFGVAITNDTHINDICTKANRSLTSSASPSLHLRK